METLQTLVRDNFTHLLFERVVPGITLNIFSTNADQSFKISVSGNLVSWPFFHILSQFSTLTCNMVWSSLNLFRFKHGILHSLLARRVQQGREDKSRQIDQ